MKSKQTKMRRSKPQLREFWISRLLGNYAVHESFAEAKKFAHEVIHVNGTTVYKLVD